ncbi:fluoride efflux transporter CrcB [Nocardioides sp. dk4132]|uniref:fluoride efflux transporter CrcB n=1 Tax=Nocardioides TaxID=1839 RepID=UPI001297192F|nr:MULTISPECIES: fluoride efflux transporter CrcB [Nocardioides]MQW78064.1 fluoride efflux transporter CrcB [Nocardioides sp. dk4132]QGA08166.1 fluoride efflux transporter CrcB [Nocardioides sp. dk884]
MTLPLYLLLVLTGGVGAALRYVLDGLIGSRTKGSSFPWATTIINVSGAFVLGLLTGLVAGRMEDTDVRAILAVGPLGGYTTFSTASYEAVQLVRQKQYGLALAYGVGVLVVCVGVAFVGYYYGSRA